MEKPEFLNFCHTKFIDCGFSKAANGYYKDASSDILCALFLQMSSFGAFYYLNCGFYIKRQGMPSRPKYTDLDICTRLTVLSKEQRVDGKQFLTDAIYYEEYEKEELGTYFDEAFKTWILPPVYKGKKFLLENLERYYGGLKSIHPLRTEFVWKALSE